MTRSIAVDETLLTEVAQVCKCDSDEVAVEIALREYLARHRRHPVLDLVGKDLLSPDYDVRAVRERMNDGSG